MRATLTGDTGDFICMNMKPLEDGQAIIDGDGIVRLRVNSDSYIVRCRLGKITLHNASEWPSTVKGKKVKITLEMRVWI